MKKLLAGVVLAALVGAVGFAHRDRIEERFTCANKIATQWSTTNVVPGAYNCLDPYFKALIQEGYGISSASDLAAAVGIPPKYDPSVSYLGETNDQGFTYRIDAKQYPHNEFSAVKDEIATYFTHRDQLTIQELGQVLWAEVNGNTQGNVSIIFTVYLYPPGSMMNFNDKVYDVSGDMETIK